MKRLIALALFAVVVAFPACRESDVVSGRGTIHAGSGDCGGAWFVNADTGRDYNVGNLASEFQQSGLRVRFVLEKRGGYSICQYGAIATVVSMTRL
jgi:hypothetical protein